MMQDFFKKMNLNFWVDTASKNIFGIELQIVDLDVNQSGQKLGTMSFNFTQEMELIEATEISVPENVASIEEILDLLFMGEQVNGGEPVDVLSILSVEQLLELQNGVTLCLQNNKTFNAPNTDTQICDDLADAPNWPILDNGYQWSREYSVSDFGSASFNFCVYKEGVPGIACSYSDSKSGCFKQACAGNIDLEPVSSFDSDGDLLSDEEEVNEHLTNPNSYDTDSDGLDDGLEVLQFLTDPNKSDTDGDGYLDGQEVNNGYNPLGDGLLELK